MWFKRDGAIQADLHAETMSTGASPESQTCCQTTLLREIESSDLRRPGQFHVVYRAQRYSSMSRSQHLPKSLFASKNSFSRASKLLSCGGILPANLRRRAKVREMDSTKQHTKQSREGRRET